MAQFSQSNPGSVPPVFRGPIGTAAATFGPWPASFGSQAAPTGEPASADGQPYRPQPRPGGAPGAPQQLELPSPDALPGLLQRMQIPRYYAQEFIGDGTYGSVANAVDLLHPAAREFAAHVVAKRFPLPAPPREARVARKALSEKSGAIKFVVRELSALQEIRRLQEARAAAPEGSMQRAALDGVQYVLRLMDVEQRPSGFPTIVTELCETTLLSFMKCFEKNRAPLCCVRTFAAQLAAAVAAMHDSVGMLHRDLKPDNVLLAMVEDAAADPAQDSEGRSPVSPAWLHVDPTANGAGDSYSASTPLHRPTSTTSLQSPGEPFTQPRGFTSSDPGTEPRLQPTPSGNVDVTAGAACCPFCGTELSAAAAATLLEGFRGPPPTATRPGSRPRRRQADHEPAAVEGSYLAALFAANGVERRCAVDAEDDADNESQAVPSHYFALSPRGTQRRCRLEVRVCDFGSACFIGPQPEVAAHGLAGAAVPPVGLPLCSMPPPSDPSDTSHSMAPASTAAGTNTPVPADADAIDRVEPQQRPYVTHGWTTLQYRAPEDMLSSADQLASSPGPQPDDVFRLARPRLGPSVDVWALGAIFAEMLSGQILFYEPSVFNLDPVVDSPWAQLVGILRVVGAPMCRTCRPGGCPDDGAPAVPCGSGQCWASLAHIATHGRFVRPLSARQQQHAGMRGPRMVDHTLDVDPRTGALACLPQFRPSLHAFAKGRLAQRCVELDFAAEAASDAEDDADVVAEIAEGISPEASATFDLLSRMLILDPTRRIASWEILEHPVFASVRQRSGGGASTSATNATSSTAADGTIFKLPLQHAE